MKKYTHFKEIFSFSEGITKLFENTKLQDKTAKTCYWLPAVDIYITESAYVLKADLPAVSQDSISITIQDNILMISGIREIVRQGRKYHQLERPTGTFSRSFTLTETADIDNIDAVMSDGVLTVVIPKKNNSDNVKVQINTYEETRLK